MHVHFKVFIDDKDMLTGQMYFPDALSQYIFANVGAYSRKVVRTVFNGNDGLALSDTTRGDFATSANRPITIWRRWSLASAAP